MTKWIFLNKFLARAEEPRKQTGRYTVRRRGEKETPKRLYVAGLDTLTGVENMCLTLERYGVTLMFADNPTQPSYSPELQVTGTHANLLKALAYFCNNRHAPDEVSIKLNTMILWWD